MESKKEYLQLAEHFTIGQEDTNDQGVLTICKTLKEITSLYDLTIILAFGDLNYYRILTSSYHIDFINHAYWGDNLVVESDATLYHGISLEVNITMRKKSRKGNTVISKAHFIFTLQNTEQPQPFSLS